MLRDHREINPDGADKKDHVVHNDHYKHVMEYGIR